MNYCFPLLQNKIRRCGYYAWAFRLINERVLERAFLPARYLKLFLVLRFDVMNRIYGSKFYTHLVQQRS